MMRKYFILLITVLCVNFVGCGSQENRQESWESLDDFKMTFDSYTIINSLKGNYYLAPIPEDERYGTSVFRGYKFSEDGKTVDIYVYILGFYSSMIYEANVIETLGGETENDTKMVFVECEEDSGESFFIQNYYINTEDKSESFLLDGAIAMKHEEEEFFNCFPIVE